MKKITKCLNDWNATIEALGQGKQTILIRTYDTSLKEFLLYPTISYSNDKNVLNSFKKEYKNFSKENLLPDMVEDECAIKYYAKVVKVLKNSPTLNFFDDYHIWENSHVKDYVKRKQYFIWILRVYELEEPVFLKRSKGIRYSNVDREVSLENLKPVISDEEFEEIFNNLKKYKI